MGFFQFSLQKTMDAYVQEAKKRKDCYILDVRTPEEYADGHIPGSINLPLSNLEEVTTLIKDLAAPVYLYCRSGARSGQGAGVLKRMGYRQVINMGGIMSYGGITEKGGITR